MFKERVETLHGIVRHIIVRVASFRRPLGIFSSTAFVSVIEIIVETEAFLVDGAQRACWDVARHSPALHRSSGTISSIARHFFFNKNHRVGEAKRGVAFPKSARGLFHVRVNILALRCFC